MATTRRQAREAAKNAENVVSDAVPVDQASEPVKAPRKTTRRGPSKKTTASATEEQEPEAVASGPNSRNEASEAVSRSFDATVYNGEREFGYWAGNLSMMIGFPLLMWYLYICCVANDSQLMFPAPGEGILAFIKRLAHLTAQFCYPTKRAWKIEGGYFIFQLMLALWLPGGLWTQGMYVPHLKRHLDYYCNAYQALYVSIALSLVLHFTGIFYLPTILAHFGEIMSVSIIMGFAFSVFIYVQSLWQGTAVRMSGNTIHDFFMGGPLYPRLGIVDFKLFFEVRLPWFTLIFLALALVLHQYEKYGYVTNQALYVFYGAWLYGNACAKGEHLIVPSWDMYYEKFGFMLIFWNLSGVPFTYCYNTLYLYSHDPQDYQISTGYKVFLWILISVAYYFFDTANGQKNSFRLKMQGKLVHRNAFPVLPLTILENPDYIKTKSGSLLLTGGWFKYARKAHYTADFTQNLCWALITGFNSPLPYFYPAFFLGMILHRTKRDFEKMEKKYGEDWEEYKRRCPWVYIPWVF